MLRLYRIGYWSPTEPVFLFVGWISASYSNLDEKIILLSATLYTFEQLKKKHGCLGFFFGDEILPGYEWTLRGLEKAFISIPFLNNHGK